VQVALEQWRAENPSYANCSPAPCGSGTYPTTPTSDYYTITLSDQSATTYTIKATPKGAQAGDRCGTYTFKLVSGEMQKAAGAGSCSL
jgi:type IV pilus assembly protein PilE